MDQCISILGDWLVKLILLTYFTATFSSTTLTLSRKNMEMPGGTYLSMDRPIVAESVDVRMRICGLFLNCHTIGSIVCTTPTPVPSRGLRSTYIE
ncbi:hypothetical protein BDW42DRAFT_176608 [Aspergillus taichungensis]|uniref:Uncharacterized protein n=1 Tax=Aspergillus taichungensis TaxID=482145 RepID=A0A2J5HKI6_9EURO|nr:hypothetical protein BDW42DRAFT_176608 [Aspergillus taichungensis]